MNRALFALATALLLTGSTPAHAGDVTVNPGDGVVYKIKPSTNTGLCVNIANGSFSTGKHVEIVDYYCANFDDNKAEKWTLAADGTLRVNGYCLQRGGLANGSWVKIEDCSGNPDQQWRRGFGGQLYNPGTDLCLTAFQVHTGQDLQTRTCDDADTGQSWVFDAYRAADTTPTSGNVYGYGGQCAVWFYITDGSPPANGSQVTVEPCTDSRVQAPQWTVGADGTLRAWYVDGGGNVVKSQSCLGISRGSAVSGAGVSVWQCNGAATQEWWPMTDGSLSNAATGLCLTADSSAVSASGEKYLLEAETCDQSASQVWSLPPDVEA